MKSCLCIIASSTQVEKNRCAPTARIEFDSVLHFEILTRLQGNWRHVAACNPVSLIEAWSHRVKVRFHTNAISRASLCTASSTIKSRCSLPCFPSLSSLRSPLISFALLKFVRTISVFQYNQHFCQIIYLTSSHHGCKQEEHQSALRHRR